MPDRSTREIARELAAQARQDGTDWSAADVYRVTEALDAERAGRVEVEKKLNDLLRKRRWLNVTPEDTAVVMLPEATYARLVEALESGLALLPTFDDPAVFDAWKEQVRAALGKVEGPA